jgi:alpha-ketoglutarate-dependent taurine dioxygenase
MPNTQPIIMTSYDEIVQNLDLVIEKFKEETIVVIRGANLTTDEQGALARAIGDKVGWFPNNSSKFEQRYQENHARLEKKEEAGPDKVVLTYHVEHVDYDLHTPIIAGVWNMIKFTADPESGKTYFTDTSLIFRQMPEEWQQFLKRCTTTWSESDNSGPFLTPAVQTHWLTGQDVIRIDIHDIQTTPEYLYTVDGREPTTEERQLFVTIRDHYVTQILDNPEVRIVHRWQQGDIVIPDLFKHAHAATGGFSSDQREFVGLWIYPSNPDTDEYLEYVNNIASKRADG